MGRYDLWKHQQGFVDFASTRDHVIGDMCMGSGKTWSALQILCDEWEARLVLIFAPKSVVSTVWPKAVREFVDGEWRIIPLTQSAVPARLKRMTSEGKQWVADGRPGTLAFVVNYEATNNDKMLAQLTKVPWQAVIADEIHRIKGPKAKVSKHVAKIFHKCRKRIGLTGTLMPHSPGDLWAQMRAINPDVFGKSYFRFYRQYGVMGGYQGKQVVSWVNTDEMMERCRDVIYRVTEEDANLNLPEMRNEYVELDLSPKARKAYDDLEADAIAQVEAGLITASNGLVKLLRLMQLTSGLAVTEELDELGEVVARVESIVDTAKLEWLTDLFIDNPGRAIVVFGRFNVDLANVHKAAAAAGMGSLEVSGKRKELEEWQRGDQPILAVQIGAGAEGVDLTRANRCVFMSTGLRSGDLQQALKRAHRPGQTDHVLNTFLVCSKTVDVTITQAHRNRKKFVDAVLDYLRAKQEEPA